MRSQPVSQSGDAKLAVEGDIILILGNICSVVKADLFKSESETSHLS